MTSLAIPRRTWLMYAPGALLALWAVLAVFGVTLVPSSTAASASGTTDINAEVTPELHSGGDCLGASYTGGTMSVANNDTLLGGNCTVTFGTNNGASGAQMRVESNRPAGNPTFCQAAPGVACSGGTFTDAALGGSAADMAEGEFGVEVMAAQTCSTPTWNFATNRSYGVQNEDDAPGTGNMVCSQNAGSDASYLLRFEADPTGTQTSGTYEAQIIYNFEAN